MVIVIVACDSSNMPTVDKSFNTSMEPKNEILQSAKEGLKLNQTNMQISAKTNFSTRLIKKKVNSFDELLSAASTVAKSSALTMEEAQKILESDMPFDNKMAVAMKQIYTTDTNSLFIAEYIFTNLYEMTDNEDEKQKIRARLGITYFNMEKPEKSLYWFKNALEEIEAGKTIWDKRLALRGMTFSLNALKKYDEALEYAQKCYNYEKKQGGLNAHTFAAIPIIHYNKGEYSEAIKLINTFTEEHPDCKNDYLMDIRLNAKDKKDGMFSSPYKMGF